MSTRRAEQLQILRQGFEAWNKWRSENLQIRPVFREAQLGKADLLRVDLGDAELSEADLRWSNLLGVNLRGANLTGAKLIGANLTGANLTNAKLIGAKLVWTNVTESNLDEANFNCALVGRMTLANNDLSRVKFLETVRHFSPSTIGIDTIYKSQGKIPEVFLRGCGVPEDFITYMHSLVGRTIQYYSCFISHSTKDLRFCERLYADLQAKGIRTWYFPEDARWGQSMWGEIDRGITLYDKLVVVCSQNSLTSGPVLREIERALQREDDELRGTGHAKHVLFPIALDRHLFEEWQHPRKADVLAKVVGTFQGWNRSAEKYAIAFDRLLRSLQTAEPE